MHSRSSNRRAPPFLLVEQNISFAKRLGDQVAVMDNGRVVHAGTMKELADNEDLQHALLGLAI
jgi:branched-chain amino acid transport system ATP-binding protein